MKRFFLWSVTLAVLLFGGFGCEKEDIDQAAEITIESTKQGEQILESPLGVFIPADVQEWIRLGGALATGLAMTWQQWRKKDEMKKVAKSIVKAVDESEGNPTEGIKSKVAEQLKANKVYGTGKRIIDDLKNA